MTVWLKIRETVAKSPCKCGCEGGIYIVREDTLISPQHWDDQPFELIVSNPPFSVPWEGDKNPLLINDPRFSPAGVLAPASKGDMAFIMHSLAWLANNGAAAIVCFPGIMYRGGAEQKIRKYLVDNNYVDAIIQLPSNLFLNVTISVDIMLLRKNKSDNAILFVDASGEFVKVTKNNRLSEENIQRIVSAVAARKNEEYFCRLVPNTEVGSKRRGYTNEKMEERTGISSRMIQDYRNKKDAKPTLQSVLALCIGLNLHPSFSYDLITKAGYNIMAASEECFLSTPRKVMAVSPCWTSRKCPVLGWRTSSLTATCWPA